ncbi:tripartite tricarboxylate transporter substrate binding protein [Variovorax robiniae]|uniref:Tripartite tricarboxylate transporter substrate binding protein n=1 Tax=Variovorax robiniae TaxID=1836199 RepID=A0ABU8X9L8_9BURK
MITRPSFLALGMACACMLLIGARVDAQELTRGTISLVVPYPSGGVSDVLARDFAPAFAKAIDRTVIVENLSGASGSIGAAKVLGGAHDGSLVLVGTSTETILTPITIKGLNYKPADFRLLGVVYTAPLALYARRDLKAGSVDELAALSKRPGNAPLNYGSTGPGSLYHIVTENLNKATGLDATHIPYRGGAPLLQDLMAGTIDLTMLPVDNVLGTLVDGGKIKVLGVAAAKRAARYPATPTLDESASARGFGHPTVWVGIFVARNMPDDLTLQMHRAVTDALEREDTRRLLETTGGTVPPTMGLQEASAFYDAETRSLQTMARVARVQGE